MWLGLLKNNWQYIAIGALLLIGYGRIVYVSHERDDALALIEKYRIEASTAKYQNELSKKQGEINAKEITDKSLQDIQTIGERYGKGLKNAQDAINYRDDVIKRLRQAGNSSSGMPENDSNQPTIADSDSAIVRPIESENDYKMMYLGARSYIETLEQAGAIAASDYNTCKAYVDGEQSRIGVSD